MEKFISCAIRSVLSQSFKDFEFIIVEDGSQDSTADIINQFKDERIVLLKNEKNKGLIYSLNRGLSCARGEYIARFDSDDIMLPGRLECHNKYLDSHPEIGLVSSQSIVMHDGYKTGMFKNFTQRHALEIGLLAKCTISHTCVTFRSDMLKKAGLMYSDDFMYMEDYGLWTSMLGTMEYRATPHNFAVYRKWGGSATDTYVSDDKAAILFDSRCKVIRTALSKFNITLTDEEFDHYTRAVALCGKQVDPDVLCRAINSIEVQIPPKYRSGMPSLRSYWYHIWWSATKCEYKSAACRTLNIKPRIWHFKDFLTRAFYRRAKIKVRYD